MTFLLGCDIHWSNNSSINGIYRIRKFGSKALFNHKSCWDFDTVNSNSMYS